MSKPQLSCPPRTCRVAGETKTLGGEAEERSLAPGANQHCQNHLSPWLTVTNRSYRDGRRKRPHHQLQKPSSSELQIAREHILNLVDIALGRPFVYPKAFLFHER